jgi:hypothetical protein
MALPGFTESPMLPLRGAWRDMDQVQPDLVRGRAFEAQNVRVLPGRIRTRNGHVATLAVPGKTTSLFQWLPVINWTRYNYLFYLSNGNLYYKNMADASAANVLYASTARGMIVAEAADKLYIAEYSQAGAGNTGLRIAVIMSAGQKWDNAFSGPLVATASVSELPGGVVTPGTHRIGFLPEYRSGHVSNPGPIAAPVPVLPGSRGTFAPHSHTVAATGKQLQVTFTIPNTPADIAYIHAIMTRADNPNNWFIVPDATAAVAPSMASFPATLNINFTDEDLANRATSALDYFNVLSRDYSGTPPFQPSAVLTYGNRLVCIANDKAYVSNAYDYEYVTEARHAVQLPGRRPIVNAGVLGSLIYWFGRNYTYASNDTGDDPRSWPTPDKISDSIGIPSPNCIEFRSTRDLGWIVSRAGLWAFTGQYSDKPVTYLWRTDWDAINWNAAYSIVIKEDPTRQLVYVAVPMGAATEPTHVFVVDYSRGIGAFDVDITIDTFTGFTPTSLALIEDAQAVTQMWMAPGAAGSMWKQAPNTFNDAGAAIDSIYESGYLLDFYNSSPSQMEYLYFDVSGAGFLEATFNCKDRTRSRILPPVALTATPGRLTTRLVQMVGANGSAKFRTNEADHYFDLRSLSVDSKPFGVLSR